MKKDIALLKEDVNKLRRRVRELEKEKEKQTATTTTKSVTQIECQPTSTGKDTDITKKVQAVQKKVSYCEQ